MSRHLLVFAAVLGTLPGIGWAQPTSGPPTADRPILLCDDAMIHSMSERGRFRPVPARRMPRAEHAAPAATFPTVLRDGPRSWKFYGRGERGLVYAESADGVTWEQRAGALLVPADAWQGFAPMIDRRPGVSPDEKYKALGASAGAGGDLFALASADGKVWRKLDDRAVTSCTARESCYGRNSAFWSDQAGVYVACVSQRRDGRRVISRMTSKDFVQWTALEPLQLNAESEDIWSATVFPIESRPPLVVALLARTASGATGPADICLALSRDGGQTFQRRFPEAWIRPAADVTAWQRMVPSPWVLYDDPRHWFRAPSQMFFAGGTRYEIFQDRFIACTAAPMKPALPAQVPGAWDPTEIVTRPFVVAGSVLEMNVSTDSTGGFRCEILDVNGDVLPGYSRNDCIRSAGIGGGYIWVGRERKEMAGEVRRFKRPIAGDHFGDSLAMPVAWRVKQRSNGTAGDRMMVYMDADISELKGKTVRLRIIAHGADIFAFRTADRKPVEGTVVELPSE